MAVIHDTSDRPRPSGCRACGQRETRLDSQGLCDKCSLLRAHACAMVLARDLEALATELEWAMPTRGVLGVQVGETDTWQRLEPLIERLSGRAPVARRLPGLADKLRKATPSEGFLGIQVRENDIADELAGIVSVVRKAAREEQALAERLAPSLPFTK